MAVVIRVDSVALGMALDAVVGLHYIDADAASSLVRAARPPTPSFEHLDASVRCAWGWLVGYADHRSRHNRKRHWHHVVPSYWYLLSNNYSSHASAHTAGSLPGQASQPIAELVRRATANTKANSSLRLLQGPCTEDRSLPSICACGSFQGHCSLACCRL